jgi:SAM-dependent methyltransferase
MNDMDSRCGSLDEDYLRVRYGKHEYTEYPQKLTCHLAHSFLSHCNQGCRLLDLGSGRGEFLSGFRKLDFEAHGIDRALMERRFQDPFVLSDLENQFLPFADNSYDVIFNKSVLEHITNIHFLLQEMRRILKPSGIVLSMVPDWRAQWYHFYDDYTHVRPFTLVGLVQLFESQGFKILHAQRFRQLPIVWKYPWFHLVCNLLALLPDSLKRYKLVRFSKEWMLLVVAQE